MGKRTDRAMDVMRERNRRYLDAQSQNTEQEKDRPEPDAAVPDQTELPENSDVPDVPDVPDIPAETADPEEAGDFRAERADGESREAYEDDELLPEEKAAAFHEAEKNPRLEKGDLPAMIIAAFLVFGPVFLVLFGILALAWLFLH